MLSCFAEDLGQAIYKPTALFAANQGLDPAPGSAEAGCEALPLNKTPTERKYTFSLAASMARVTLLGHWPLIADILTTN